MSDLQIGLIILGGLLLLLVVCFNWWQDRRIRRSMTDRFPEAPVDPLMAQLDKQRREPSVRIAEQLGKSGQDKNRIAEDIDPMTEAVIDIHFPQPITGQELIQLLRTYLRADTKPVRLLVSTVNGAHHAYPNEDEQYVSMLLVALLANRAGPISEIEWSHLWMAGQNLAQHADGTIDGPEQEEVIARAQQLDQLCATLDAQVSIRLLLPEPTATSLLHQVAISAGFMEYGEDLAWLASSGLPRFTLLFNGKHALKKEATSVDVMDLFLDLPNSPKDEQAFSRMASVGRDLALRLGASLVDDQHQPLSDHFDQDIDKQLIEMYERLETAGFYACEARTQRVFK